MCLCQTMKTSSIALVQQSKTHLKSKYLNYRNTTTHLNLYRNIQRDKVKNSPNSNLLKLLASLISVYFIALLKRKERLINNYYSCISIIRIKFKLTSMKLNSVKGLNNYNK